MMFMIIKTCDMEVGSIQEEPLLSPPHSDHGHGEVAREPTFDSDSEEDDDYNGSIDPRVYRGAWQKAKHWRGPVTCLRRPSTPAAIAFAYGLLAVSIAVELYLATIGIMLSLDQTDTTWLVLVATTWPRVAFFLLASILLDPFRFWVQWLKVDGVMVTCVATIIAYAFFVEADPEDSAGLRHAAIASYAPLMLALSGHVRVMAKYFPWHQYR